MTSAEFKTLKPGDKVRPDGGYPCMGKEVKIVMADETKAEGELYVECGAGRHYLWWGDVENMEVVRD